MLLLLLFHIIKLLFNSFTFSVKLLIKLLCSDQCDQYYLISLLAASRTFEIANR